MSFKMEQGCNVEIKQEHIDEGVQRDCGKCMMSLAVNAVLKPPYSCQTRPRNFYVLDEFQRCIYVGSVPRDAELAIASFDKDRTWVQPFTTFLEIPHEYLLTQED